MLLVLAGCGTTLRASAGPTVARGGHVGVEAAVEAGTHWLSLWPASAPLAVRGQIVRVDGDTVALFGISTGVSVRPAFYGAGPPSPDRCVCGMGGHLSGTVGRSTDDTTGFRAALGVGHGHGELTRAGNERYVMAGGELAWQRDVIGTDAGLDAVGDRVTASFWVSRIVVPARELQLPSDWFTSHGK